MDANPAEKWHRCELSGRSCGLSWCKLVTVGSKKLGSISASEFKETLFRDWVRALPTPKVLRVDDGVVCGITD